MKLSTTYKRLYMHTAKMSNGSISWFILATGGWGRVRVQIWVWQTGVSFCTAPSCASASVTRSLCNFSCLCICPVRGGSLPFFLEECFNWSFKTCQGSEETLHLYSSWTASWWRALHALQHMALVAGNQIHCYHGNHGMDQWPQVLVCHISA